MPKYNFSFVFDGGEKLDFDYSIDDLTKIVLDHNGFTSFYMNDGKIIINCSKIINVVIAKMTE